MSVATCHLAVLATLFVIVYGFGFSVLSFLKNQFLLEYSCLQCCVSLHCTTKGISHMYTYSLPRGPTLPPRLPSLPSRSSQSTKPSLCGYGSFPLAISFTPGSEYISVLISQFVPPSPPMSMCPFCTLPSLFPPCKWFHVLTPSRPHTFPWCWLVLNE